jgi:hypothetical protein
MPDRRPDVTAKLPSVYEWANQVFSHTSGAPLCDGNRVVLLKDAAENYPAWLRAIDVAQRTIHFEMYIIHDDVQGTLFAEWDIPSSCVFSSASRSWPEPSRCSCHACQP